MSHSIGFDFIKAVMSNKKKEKTLPKNNYRNYFNAGEKHHDYLTISELIELGLMHVMKPEYYYVTEKGIDVLKDYLSERAIYKPVASQDLEYLKHKIDFYCEWAHYTFRNDHILQYFKNYYVEGEYVSHTTKQVINKFKPELKKYYKLGKF